jgi:hypothetical protein
VLLFCRRTQWPLFHAARALSPNSLFQISLQTPDPIISTFNYLRMEFVTDGSVQNHGFKLNYTTQASLCGGILSGSDHGIIRSPASPDRYPHGKPYQRKIWVQNFAHSFTAKLQQVTRKKNISKIKTAEVPNNEYLVCHPYILT